MFTKTTEQANGNIPSLPEELLALVQGGAPDEAQALYHPDGVAQVGVLGGGVEVRALGLPAFRSRRSASAPFTPRAPEELGEHEQHAEEGEAERTAHGQVCGRRQRGREHQPKWRAKQICDGQPYRERREGDTPE